MRLPDFANQKAPKVKREWLCLWPSRPALFWWRVGVVVRANRVRHKDREKIKAVCALVDQTFPLQTEFKETV